MTVFADEMTCDGLVDEVDLAASRVRIGGKWFPACGLVWPDNDERPEPVYDRLLGSLDASYLDDPSLDFYVVVPCENGVLAAVSDAPDHRGRAIHLLSPWAIRSVPDLYWLPRPLRVEGRRVIDGGWADWEQWSDPDPEWAAEQLVRVSGYAYTPTATERRCDMVPLVEVLNLTLQRVEAGRARGAAARGAP